MNSRGAARFPARVLALSAAWLSITLLLAACATQPLVLDDPDWLRHEASVAALQDWELRGRLFVRQNDAPDTVNISWRQQDESFDLRLFGSLGLGAVRVYGTPTQVTVEKAGAEPATLPGLGAVTQEYFGYAFPTAELLYWVRGLPAPELGGRHTYDTNRMLATLQQEDASGLAWNLTFDRYLEIEGAAGTTYLPGRIRAEREGLELLFRVSNWTVPEVVP